MSLSFANAAGNLFNRLGRYGKLAHVSRTFQTDLKTYFDALMAQYDSSVASPLQLPASGLAAQRDATREAASAFMSSLSSNAGLTVTEMIKADKPTSAWSLQESLEEVRRQMIAAPATIKLCTVTGSSAAGPTNSGDGVMVVSVKRGDGLSQELLYPEAAYVRCFFDSQTSGATSGQETFAYLGPVSAQSVWSPDYPINSGLTTFLSAIDATVDGTAGTASGNILVNGAFENFTANLPDNWTAVTGVAGTDFQKSTATVYSGAASLQYIGGATLTNLAQTLTTLSGTLLPSTSYAVNFWTKVSAVPAAGVLTVELVDGNNAVINDDQGVANSFTVALTGLTTSFAAKNGVFRMPKLVPSTVKIRLRLSTALSVGSNLFIDRMSMGSGTQAYPGGPGLWVFSGNTKFVVNDFFTLTTTNDYGGATNLSTFQWLLDRLLGTRQLGILFPSNGAPSISDTLITS
jgi:hypothetical protein